MMKKGSKFRDGFDMDRNSIKFIITELFMEQTQLSP